MKVNSVNDRCPYCGVSPQATKLVFSIVYDLTCGCTKQKNCAEQYNNPLVEIKMDHLYIVECDTEDYRLFFNHLMIYNSTDKIKLSGKAKDAYNTLHKTNYTKWQELWMQKIDVPKDFKDKTNLTCIINMYEVKEKSVK